MVSTARWMTPDPVTPDARMTTEGRMLARTLGRLVGLFFIFDFPDRGRLLFCQSSYEGRNFSMMFLLEWLLQQSDAVVELFEFPQ